MPMKKEVPAESPDAYVAALTGWRRKMVETLRAGVRGAAKLDERIHWGHLVYFGEGPVLLIRAEAARVLFGFWRGQRLGDIEPRLKPGGNYEMATLELREGDAIAPAIVRRLAKEAARLDRKLGNPQLAAKRTSARKAANPKKNVAAKKSARKKPDARNAARGR